MTSPARKMRQRKLAAHAADSEPTRRAAGDQHELMLAALWEARQRLKNIKSIERKVEAKREILMKFDGYIAGVLDADSGADDDVLMNVMVWRFDTGDVDGGLNIGEYALRHGLQTPDRYQRDTASVVAEQTAEEVLRLLPDCDDDLRIAELTEDANRAERLTCMADMHDPIRAKLYKAIGYGYRAQGKLIGARDMLQRAIELYGKVGVKKDIERLQREIAKQDKNADDQASA